MKVSYGGYGAYDGNFVVSHRPLDRLAPSASGFIQIGAADPVTVWHGASLWAARAYFSLIITS